LPISLFRPGHRRFFGEKPSETTINTAYQIFKEAGLNTELLIGFEGVNTGYTGNAIDDIMDMCAVHPIREDTMEENT